MLFEQADPEIYLLTTALGDQLAGQIATWVMPISLIPDPLRLIVALSPTGQTCQFIDRRGQFFIHLLATDQIPWLSHFGLYSGFDCDKFTGLDYQLTPSGLPHLKGTCAWAECEVLWKIDTGDRYLFLAHSLHQSHDPTKHPLRLTQGRNGLSPAEQDQHRQKYEADIQRARQLLQSADHWQMSPVAEKDIPRRE
ncbi:flavin reductase family protein [Candidatus Synechococcus calcipolaris G9]|uniref:Flavin reductase family protein n=1 Tax=Candidatus Synechococcus calcipolaris G9 TaxID=1497997 RepID=A0ABT6EXM6_9SYNE|nr:flavin reductase family protein [Candidatus Synechococcus calcipolaris]MDG2990497.1 flavin reductase family protein [Candidatus Synechococcus calcipolaris G9]